ncbi:MAG: PqqD family peptide modification chaperone [Theionarchaea archaeon]|nr:PqqD family peptide modification chaperone [Theionarchaea archaeon]MBU7037359.1 PqqD family peptide modification chaperone [Theionarchaea archaeon]
MNPETTYVHLGEDVYWHRDVSRVYIFSEKTGESMQGNMTAGRIMELSDGTRSVEEIGKTLLREFTEGPSFEEILELVTDFLLECENRGFVELRASPAEKPSSRDLKEFTHADVERLLEDNAVLIIDETASFELKEDDSLITYSARDGEYLKLSKEEKEILTIMLEEKPLQEVLSDFSQEHKEGSRDILVEFATQLLNRGLARIQ